jgi:hypothetical protein
MKKQTAVDWLLLNLSIAGVSSSEGLNIDEVRAKAKQMEKEQMFEYIKNLYCNGDASLKYHLEEFEQYYDKTYRDEDRPTE